jgi:glycosyltransferase involved in cell wall biosynthesis
MTTESASGIRFSVVIPVFNEQAVLPILLRRCDALMDELDGPAEIIFVDDGSTDCTSIFLKARAKDDPRYRYIGLSRNFGHQVAITAGMDAAAGDAVVVMDADLQDPPEVVLDMVARWKEGYDVVYARRLSREGENAFKRWTAHLFYRLLGSISAVRIPDDVGDFRLIDRKVADAFREMPERDRFVRGMFAWLGFKQTEVAFHRLPRAAGETKYPLWKMLRLAVAGAIGFSDAPLRLAIWLGLSVSVFAVLYGTYVISQWIIDRDLVTGWASTIVVISFLSGINLLMTGLMGLYVGRIHAEVKRRPLYVVESRIGFDRASGAQVQPSQRNVEKRSSVA